MKVSLRRVCFSFAFLFLLFGCAGGGSQGTGGMRFQGSLYGQSSLAMIRALTPLSGITVTIGESGDSAVTDERGYYSITTEWTAPDVELFFDANGFNTKYLVRSVPENASVVTLDFAVDRAANSVRLINRDIETGNGSDSSSPGGQSSSAPSNGSSGSSPGGPSSNAGSRGSSSGSSQSTSKVTICHNPDSKNPVTITVSEDALPAHLAHGDTLGPCPEDE